MSDRPGIGGLTGCLRNHTLSKTCPETVLQGATGRH